MLNKFLGFLLIIVCINACEKDDANNKLAFEITDHKKVNNNQNGWGFAKLILTVKNNSSRELSGWAYIKIKRGNTIIESETVSFDYLNPGESSEEEAWFSKFNKHSEYDIANVKLYWNIDSFGYSREYNF